MATKWFLDVTPAGGKVFPAGPLDDEASADSMKTDIETANPTWAVGAPFQADPDTVHDSYKVGKIIFSTKDGEEIRWSDGTQEPVS